MTNNSEINNIAPDYELNAKILACFFYNNLRIPYNEFPQLKITGLKALDGSLILHNANLLNSFGILEEYWNYNIILRELELINKCCIEKKEDNKKQISDKVIMMIKHVYLNLKKIETELGKHSDFHISIDILYELNRLYKSIEIEKNDTPLSPDFYVLFRHVNDLIKKQNVKPFFKLFRNSQGKVLTTGSEITFNYGSNKSKTLTKSNIHEVLDIPFIEYDIIFEDISPYDTFITTIADPFSYPY